MRKILLFSFITSIFAALATYYKGVPAPSSEADLPVRQQPAQKTLSPSSAHATAKRPFSGTASDNQEVVRGPDTEEKNEVAGVEMYVSSGNRDKDGKNSLSSSEIEADVFPPIPEVVPGKIKEKTQDQLMGGQDSETKIAEGQRGQGPKLKKEGDSQDLDSHSIAELMELASRDGRAAFDLGLRYFRGDGVEQNSYEAIEWMRKAGVNGNLNAQAALGRIYLTGLEEMGPDLQEAHKWLLIAASRGDEASSLLLDEAEEGLSDDRKYHSLKKGWHMQTYRCWYSNYAYNLYWHDGRWLVY